MAETRVKTLAEKYRAALREQGILDHFEEIVFKGEAKSKEYEDLKKS